jgi:hypothetical protein
MIFGLVIGFIELLQLITTTVLLFTHFTIHYMCTKFSHYIFTECCLVAACNSRRSPSSGFPNCPWPQLPASHSISSQLLNRSSPPTNSLSHQPTLFTNSLLVLCITSQHAPRRKHCSSVAVELLRSCLLAEPLPSNGCCIVAYFVVVA